MSERADSLTVSVEEAGRRLGIGRSLAYDLARRGELPALRLGTRLVVSVSGLEDMVRAAGRQAPLPQTEGDP